MDLAAVAAATVTVVAVEVVSAVSGCEGNAEYLGAGTGVCGHGLLLLLLLRALM